MRALVIRDSGKALLHRVEDILRYQRLVRVLAHESLALGPDREILPLVLVARTAVPYQCTGISCCSRARSTHYAVPLFIGWISRPRLHGN
jgi:hypothetical protein